MARAAAALLRRVFGDDVSQCPRCSDSLRVLAPIPHPEVTARILEHLGLSPRPFRGSLPLAPP